MEKKLGMNENVASLRCSDLALVKLMERASKDLRVQETEVTNEMLAVYARQEEFCERIWQERGYNPGGWCAVFRVKEKAAALSVRAVAIEN